MKKHILYFILIVLFSTPVKATNNACIEPRNSISQDTVANIQWALDNNSIYISTMGTVWKLGNDNSLELLHTICDGRFPVIAVSEMYYAIGSSFLPRVLIYDTVTNQLFREITIPYENTRFIDFSVTEANLVLSTSNWDETGFFDIDRNIELWDINTGEVLKELIPNETDSDSIYLALGSNANFLSNDAVLVAGVDREDPGRPPQPLVYLWNWQTGSVEQLTIDANIGLGIANSSLVSINSREGGIEVQTTNLLPIVDVASSQHYDISLEGNFEIALFSNGEDSLLALENQDGYIWVIDLNIGQIAYSRDIGSFATVIAFDHQGQQLALGYQDGIVQVWNLSSDAINTLGDVFEG
jgi:WD40 repeat protein